MLNKPYDVLFLEWAIPRVGQSALGMAHSGRINAVVELLIEKGIFTRTEIDEKYSSVFDSIKQQIASIPVMSPMQNRPRSNS